MGVGGIGVVVTLITLAVGNGVAVTRITFAVGNGVTVGIGAGVATTAEGAGAITATGVGVLVGVAPDDVGFNLTATVWLESICILAVLPSML